MIDLIVGLQLIGIGFIMGILVSQIIYLISIGRGNSINWERDFPNGSIAHEIRRERAERRKKLLARFGIRYKDDK